MTLFATQRIYPGVEETDASSPRQYAKENSTSFIALERGNVDRATIPTIRAAIVRYRLELADPTALQEFARFSEKQERHDDRHLRNARGTVHGRQPAHRFPLKLRKHFNWTSLPHLTSSISLSDG
jgi:hypothetical protein